MLDLLPSIAARSDARRAETDAAPNAHNPLIRAIIEDLCPRFTPGAEAMASGERTTAARHSGKTQRQDTAARHSGKTQRQQTESLAAGVDRLPGVGWIQWDFAVKQAPSLNCVQIPINPSVFITL